MRIEVRLARSDEVAAFYGSPQQYRIVRIDGVPAAIGGVVISHDGRRWGFLDVKPEAVSNHGMAIVRALSRGMREIGGPIYVTSQVDQFETADRLLALVGFVPTEDMLNERRVWVWQN